MASSTFKEGQTLRFARHAAEEYVGKRVRVTSASPSSGYVSYVYIDEVRGRHLPGSTGHTLPYLLEHANGLLDI